MRALIAPSEYLDQDVFDREQAVFEKYWRCVGTVSQAPNDQDWFTTTVSGRSIVVQNFEGALRAFANVCSHRFSAIRREASGNGMLQCSYHGWIYNKEGIPYSIPRKPRFDDMTDERRCELALERYDLELCGTLVFIRRHGMKESLREYMGPMFEVFESASKGIGPLLDSEERVWKANWKICMENILEGYHIPFVHKETLYPLGIANHGTFTMHGWHAVYDSPVNDERKAAFEKVGKTILSKRPYKVDGWHHLFVFPLTTMGTTYGASFNIPQFIPMSPHETLFRNHVYGCALPELPAAQAAVVTAMNATVASSHRQVFQEDSEVCERVHEGTRSAQHGGALSDEELRVLKFQEGWVQTMRSTQTPAAPPLATTTASY